MGQLTVKPGLKWHGGKVYLAPKIHQVAEAVKGRYFHRAIAYAGGMGEVWNWDCEGISEVVNDLDGRLTNLWDVWKSRELFPEFQRLCAMTPVSELEWERSRGTLEDKLLPEVEKLPAVERVRLAHLFFVYVRQSLSGRMDAFTSITRNRVRGKKHVGGAMNGEVSAWISAVEGMDAVHRRLWRVVIRHMPAIQFIKAEDGPKTLHYLDPPYLDSTRVAKRVYGGGRQQLLEMATEDHGELLETILDCRGLVMLSGYRSPLYDTVLRSWNRHDFSVTDCASMATTKRLKTESIWANF